MRISDWSSDVCSSDLQHLRLDRAAPRLQHDADRLVRFVADVGEDRQFLLGDQRRDLLDQLALLHLERDFGDDGRPGAAPLILGLPFRSEEHTSELQSLMRISYAVFCLKKTNNYTTQHL